MVATRSADLMSELSASLSLQRSHDRTRTSTRNAEDRGPRFDL